MISNKGGADFVKINLPQEVKKLSINYLNENLGAEYVSDYISFNSAYYSEYFNVYDIYFNYNFPYDAFYSSDKSFSLRMPKNGVCCTGNIPSKPYQFLLSGEEALNKAKEIGMDGDLKVGFSFFEGIIVEHNPINSASKNSLSIQDYLLVVYKEYYHSGEIIRMYLNSDTGEVIGYYLSDSDYQEGQIVSATQATP